MTPFITTSALLVAYYDPKLLVSWWTSQCSVACLRVDFWKQFLPHRLSLDSVGSCSLLASAGRFAFKPHTFCIESTLILWSAFPTMIVVWFASGLWLPQIYWSELVASVCLCILLTVGLRSTVTLWVAAEGSFLWSGFLVIRTCSLFYAGELSMQMVGKQGGPRNWLRITVVATLLLSGSDSWASLGLFKFGELSLGVDSHRTRAQSWSV